MFLGKHLLLLLAHPGSNGTLDAFGVVTRPWSEELVNLTAFPDCSPPVTFGSVPVVDDLAAAQAKRDAGYGGPIAYHPPRPAHAPAPEAGAVYTEADALAHLRGDEAVTTPPD